MEQTIYQNNYDQFIFDVNWYFVDMFKRLCIVASGGGVLPKFYFYSSYGNDEFHEMAMGLPETFESKRIENVLENIDGVASEDVETYFRDFERLAKRGFYVFDKRSISNAKDDSYLLVAYPIYNTQDDRYPVSDKYIDLIPRINTSIIFRRNNIIGKTNFRPKKLVAILDAST